jgi:hypothetical protein
VGLEVVVHVELGVLLVDDFGGPLSIRVSRFLGITRLRRLTGGGCGHDGGLCSARATLAIACQNHGFRNTHEVWMSR